MKAPAFITTNMDKLDALSLRERALVFLAIGAVVYALLNAFVWSPLQAKQKNLKLEQARVAGEIIIAQTGIEQKVLLQAHDPDEANKKRQQQLQEQKIGKSLLLTNQQSALVPSDKIASLLEGVLKQHPRLRLVSLRSIERTGSLRPAQGGDANSGQTGLPKAPATDAGASNVVANLTTAALSAAATTPASTTATSTAPEAASGTTKPGTGAAAAAAVGAAAAGATKPTGTPVDAGETGPIFRHGVSLVVEGTYLDLLDYLTALEQLPGKIYWGTLELEVKTWPKAYLSVELYTLSLDRKWLNL